MDWHVHAAAAASCGACHRFRPPTSSRTQLSSAHGRPPPSWGRRVAAVAAHACPAVRVTRCDTSLGTDDAVSAYIYVHAHKATAGLQGEWSVMEP
uniref:Uncharacterized protein n=1 Tax=Zea mays TaxID=4577 RepID=A0A804UNU1_MAIZE